jgi:hypothetical protein
VIKFFTGEDMRRVEIVSLLRDHYGKDALSRTQIYLWIIAVKRGRTDLNNIAGSGREPGEGRADIANGVDD